MTDRRMAHGSAMKVVIWVLVVALIAGGGGFAYLKTRPKPVDPKLKETTAVTVPPQGIAPFDPKQLMAKLNERITTDKFRFAVIGDTKHAPTLPALVKYLEESVHPDFMLTTGDMVKSGGGQPGPGYYEMLTHELGQSMRKYAWWPAIGNHEISGTPVIQNKSEGAVMAQNQQSGTENFKRFYNLDSDYYSFAFRNSVFIALPFFPASSKQKAEAEWLAKGWFESELKKATDSKKHIFVFNHTPFFTVGSKGADDVPNIETGFTKLFKQYGVKAVFSGHDHGYYRTIRKGIPYFISAGGGATIYAGKRIKEALPEDVYYNAPTNSFVNGKPTKFVLHQGTATPEKITDTPDQFMCVVDVDGDTINCFTVTANGEKWDEIQLSK